jgi:molybdopterin synthase catalytic subunit
MTPSSAPDTQPYGARGPTTYAHGVVVGRPLDVGALLPAVTDPAAGATAMFVGTVRSSHDGRAVTGIDYQSYSSMAERQLQAIAEEAADRYGALRVVIEHRVGFLAVGEISVAIAASHERRAPAFDATRYVIEQIKRRVPIWKREHYADGTRQWVDPTQSTAPPVAVDAVGAVR